MAKAWTDEERKSRQIKITSTSKPKCPDCGDTDVMNFYYDKSGKRTNAYCTTCHKKRCSQRYHSKSMIERRAAKAISYGLTADEYVRLYENQKGKCAICNKEPQTKRGLHIDHDHITKKVRGLLCHSCNIGLGVFSDNIQTMNKAIDYLKQNMVE